MTHALYIDTRRSMNIPFSPTHLNKNESPRFCRLTLLNIVDRALEALLFLFLVLTLENFLRHND